MTAAVIVDGPAAISVDTGGSNALEALGYTFDGVRIFEDVFTADVFSDENGGPEGPPIDVQYFGEAHRVQLDFSKFDTAIMDKVRPKIYGGTAGQTGTAGSLYFAGGLTYRLLINPTSRPRNYLVALPISGPWEINKGTKYSRQRLEFICYASSGVLYNTTTS